MADGRFETLGSFTPPGFPARPVMLYLPAGHDPRMPRPLLFALDGQAVFDDAGARPGWWLHRAIETLPPDLAPVVVAIPNEGHSRADELTPWVTDGWGGGAERFLRWLADALVPAVREKVPAPAGAVGAAVLGASWGGLFALWAHFTRPDVFGGALALSPSFWVGRGQAFDFFSRHPLPGISRVYLDCGSLEDEGRMLADAEEVARILRGRGCGEDRLRWSRAMGAGHSELEWRRRLPAALGFVYR